MKCDRRSQPLLNSLIYGLLATQILCLWLVCCENILWSYPKCVQLIRTPLVRNLTNLDKMAN